MSAPPSLPLAARVRRWRISDGERMPRALLGVAALAKLDGGPLEPGDALWVAPRKLEDRATPWALVRALPDPSLIAGAIVVVAPEALAGGFFSRLIGGERPLSRAVRGAALLLRGYFAIAGGVDPASGLDLVWGEAG